jgi:hypothetical protein
VVGAALGAAVLAGLTTFMPDPTGGWLRAGLLLCLVAGLYGVSGVVTGTDLSALGRALRRPVAPGPAPPGVT